MQKDGGGLLRDQMFFVFFTSQPHKGFSCSPCLLPGGVILDRRCSRSPQSPHHHTHTHTHTHTQTHTHTHTHTHPFLSACPLPPCLPRERRPSLPKDTLSLLQGAAQTPKASATPFSTGILFDKLPSPQKCLLANQIQNDAYTSHDLRLEKEAKEWRQEKGESG